MVSRSAIFCGQKGEIQALISSIGLCLGFPSRPQISRAFMITTNKARTIIGRKARSMSDQDIQRLLDQFYGLAEVVAETVVARGSKNKSKGIEIGLSGGHNGTK